MATGPTDSEMRTPPHDMQAEMGVLGSMMLRAEAATVAQRLIGASSFYKLAHQDIYRAIAEVCREGGEPDIIRVRDALGRSGKLDKAGGQAYLVELQEAVPSSYQVEHYADIVREHACRRGILRLARLVRQAHGMATDPVALAIEIERAAADIAQQGAGGETETLDDVWAEVSERLEARATGDETGVVRSGLYALDRRLGGFHPGRLYVVVGTPGSGKTALATWILAEHCVKHKRPAVFFSAEMSAPDVYTRMVQQLGGIPGGDVWRGLLSPDHFEAWQESGAKLRESPLRIDDTSNIAIEDLVPRALHAVKTTGAELVVVDYLQLLTVRSQKETYAQVALCAKELKRLAREGNVPVLALSQQSFTEHGPRARWSRDIEQHSDAMVFIKRDDAVERNEEAEPDVVTHRYVITKNRFGPQGKVMIRFDKESLQFTEARGGDDE